MLREWILGELHKQFLGELRAMSEDELKKLWDAFGVDEDTGRYDIDDVHLVMNERGLGEYCAV